MATDEYYTSTLAGGIISSKSGGDIELDPEKPMETPGGVQATEYGAAFGPLEISAYPGSTARVGGLTFREPAGILDGLFGSGGGSGLFATLPLLAAHRADDDEDSVTRRDVIRTGAAAGLLLGGQATAAAATKTATRAEFAALENPAGIRMRVFDRVQNVLPPDRLYYSYLDGESYASFSADSSSDYGDVLPKATGTVTVGPKGSAGGFFASLGTEKTQVYEGLELPKSTSDADNGERLTISTNDIIVEHVQSAGASEATMAIGGTSIPHEHEDSESSRGYYTIHNGDLIYRAGASPPSGQTATLVLYASRSEEIFDDLERRVD